MAIMKTTAMAAAKATDGKLYLVQVHTQIHTHTRSERSLFPMALKVAEP